MIASLSELTAALAQFESGALQLYLHEGFTLDLAHSDAPPLSPPPNAPPASPGAHVDIDPGYWFDIKGLVTISSDGAGAWIDGGLLRGIFHVGRLASLTLDRVHLSRGRALQVRTGGEPCDLVTTSCLSFDTCPLSVDPSTDTSTGTSLQGGAVQVDGGTLLLRNVNISACEASAAGGAILVDAGGANRSTHPPHDHAHHVVTQHSQPSHSPCASLCRHPHHP